MYDICRHVEQYFYEIVRSLWSVWTEFLNSRDSGEQGKSTQSASALIDAKATQDIYSQRLRIFLSR